MLSDKHFQYFISLVFIILFSCEKQDNTTVIPSSSCQIILVVTDSIKATKGSLYYFERDSVDAHWTIMGDKIPVVLGRNGLGWGKGIHDSSNTMNYPVKTEGDGRSPAGVFYLSSVFGYEPEEKMSDLKMPYLQITENVECIDDVRSDYYNEIVSRDTIAKGDQAGWESSEKMRSAGIYYELGVVIDHNKNPVRVSAGSCIFLHNWADPDETMAGCTGMSPINMREIVYWLDIGKRPVFVQLTEPLYLECKGQWGLPDLPFS